METQHGGMGMRAESTCSKAHPEAGLVLKETVSVGRGGQEDAVVKEKDLPTLTLPSSLLPEQQPFLRETHTHTPSN